jgi:hypothetical protein
MRNGCVKAVRSVGMKFGKPLLLRTSAGGRRVLGVQNARLYTLTTPQFIRATVHKICSAFTPVGYVFMPTIHSPYNKQLRITKERNY